MLTRLVQLAMRYIYSDQPQERLRELLKLIEQVIDQPTALEILESLLRYYLGFRSYFQTINGIISPLEPKKMDGNWSTFPTLTHTMSYG